MKEFEEERLGEIHNILKDSYSIKAKRVAVSVIKDIGKEDSIPVLINEFEYKGRWWVRWWPRRGRCWERVVLAGRLR